MAESSSPSTPKTPHSDRIKVLVRIEQDADGYPGVNVEGLWCVPEGDVYRIDNIPFYAPGLACDDIISARLEGGELWAESLVKESGHATVWVLCRAEQAVQDVRLRARQLGCASELSNNPKFLAIDVPPDVDRAAVRAMLDEGERNNEWEFAEGVAM